MNPAIVLEQRPGASHDETGGAIERRRVYIFLTRQGFLFAVALMVMLIGAVNYSNSMAYGLTFLMTGLFFVCMLHTYRNLRGLVLRFGNIAPGFAGGAIAVPLSIDNPAGAARTALAVKLHPRERARRAARDVVTFNSKPGDTGHVVVPIETPRRGSYRLERLLLHSSWPLGLFEAWSYLDTAPGYLVFPRPAGNAALPVPREQAAPYRSGAQPGSDDFAGFRPYRPGDSIRNVDWKIWARQQLLLSKRFVGSGTQQLTLDYDLLPPSTGVEARLSQLCQWVLRAERDGHRYALRLPGFAATHDVGPLHERRCLEALARFAS